MEGKALTRSAFLQSLESQFASSLYEDPKGAMFKISQTSSVKEYQAQYESLTNRIAIHLEKHQEEKYLDCTPFMAKSFQPTAPRTGSSSSSFKPPIVVNPHKPLTPIKRISHDELQARREKGLCYNCDERFRMGHRCRRMFHLLIVEPEGMDNTANPLPGNDWEILHDSHEIHGSDQYPTQISFHALMGHLIP
ncbi:hypothetical protein KIW84_060111 [Lathyrus oleraceus]|uniref:Retrotransposon gag domain-containing protein n=1 Tax=Pisum sativum TaxID=3888 RepID=A0A9D4W1E6_PEA|nr:hypothetical protein KIW84_060111 [Pisum sativum]